MQKSTKSANNKMVVKSNRTKTNKDKVKMEVSKIITNQIIIILNHNKMVHTTNNHHSNNHSKMGNLNKIISKTK